MEATYILNNDGYKPDFSEWNYFRVDLPITDKILTYYKEHSIEHVIVQETSKVTNKVHCHIAMCNQVSAKHSQKVFKDLCLMLKPHQYAINSLKETASEMRKTLMKKLLDHLKITPKEYYVYVYMMKDAQEVSLDFINYTNDEFLEKSKLLIQKASAFKDTYTRTRTKKLNMTKHLIESFKRKHPKSITDEITNYKEEIYHLIVTHVITEIAKHNNDPNCINAHIMSENRLIDYTFSVYATIFTKYCIGEYTDGENTQRLLDLMAHRIKQRTRLVKLLGVEPEYRPPDWEYEVEPEILAIPGSPRLNT